MLPFLVLLVGLSGAAADTAQPQLLPLDVQSAAALSRFLGDPTDLGVHRLARQLSQPQVVSAIYRGTRSQRLAALESMAVAIDTLPVLPYLVALLSSSDRSVSGRAAHALDVATRTGSDSQIRFPQMPDAQRQQLASSLVDVLRTQDLAPDVRIVAWQALEAVDHAVAKTSQLVMFGLADGDVALRRMALKMVEVPADKQTTMALAERATNDDDARLRGQAASLLCENALAYGVTSPSADLSQLLLETLGDAAIPADGLAGILYCVGHFEPSNRAGFAEKALAHPDRRLAQAWKAVSGS